MSRPEMLHLYTMCKRVKKATETDTELTDYFSLSMSVDFIAGYVGGLAGVLVGHPFDTVKVHLQTQDPNNPRFRNPWHCLTTLMKQDGYRSLFRGITSPMVGIGFVNAIVFGVYGNVQRLMHDSNSLSSHFVAGSVAGLLQSVVCGPMELAKTRMQLQNDSMKGVHHKCPLDCLKYIYRTEGVKAVFKGTAITAVRDIPGFSSYFVSYEFMMQIPSEPKAAHSLLAGGLAGMCSWLACYPLDVVKTCLQADGMSSSPQYTSAIDCALKLYKNHGIPIFLRGLDATLIRSFPMNAATFFFVSLIMRFSKSSKVDMVVQTKEPLAIVSLASSHMCQMNQYQENLEDTIRKRSLMSKSLQVLGAFNESICSSEVEELAKEFYPDDSKYILPDDWLIHRIINSAPGKTVISKWDV